MSIPNFSEKLNVFGRTPAFFLKETLKNTTFLEFFFTSNWTLVVTLSETRALTSKKYVTVQ